MAATVFIPVDPTAGPKLGSIGAQAKSVDNSIKSMERAYKKAEAQGKTVDAGFTERLAKLDEYSKNLHSTLAKQQHFDKMASEIKSTERIAKGLEALTAAQFVKRFLQGGLSNLGASDVAHGIIGLERTGLRLAEKILSPELFARVARFAKILPAIGIGLEIGSFAQESGESYQQHQRDRERLERQIGLGALTKGEEEQFRKNDTFFKRLFDDPAANIQLNKQFADSFKNLNAEDQKSLFANAMFNKQNDTFHNMWSGAYTNFKQIFTSGDTMQKMAEAEGDKFVNTLQARIEDAQKRTGGNVSDYEADRIRREVVAEYTKNMSSDDKQQFNKMLTEGSKAFQEEEKAKEESFKPKTANEIYAREIEDMKVAARRRMHIKYPADMLQRPAQDVPLEGTHENARGNLGLSLSRMKYDSIARTHSYEQAENKMAIYRRD